jgi:hypothetical protein
MEGSRAVGIVEAEHNFRRDCPKVNKKHQEESKRKLCENRRSTTWNTS